MTRSDDAAKEPTAATAATGQTEKPESGRKQFDPSRYQVSTFPAEVRSEYQKLPLHKFSEEELKPPPGYGNTPAAPGVQAVVAKLRQHRIPIAIGIVIALALALVLVTWLSLRPTLDKPNTATSATASDNPAPTNSAAPSAAQAAAPPSQNSALAPITTTPRRAKPSPPPITVTPVAPRPKPTTPSKPPPEKVINVPLIDR